MAPRTEQTHLANDPALEGGEWLFRRDGQVFGPVDSRGIAAMLYRGEIDGATPVSAGDGTWLELSEISLFLLHAKKAEAGLRVEREVTGERLLRARKSRRRAIALGVAALLVVGGAGGGAMLLSRKARESSPLLEDFGAGIGVVSAARVGVSGRDRAGEELFEVALETEAERAARAPRAARPAGTGAPRGAVEEGDLVASHFDERKIQSVVGREQRTLAPCFRAEASRSPDFQGDVPIEFAIGNDGRVARVWIDEPRFRAGALRECIEQALAGWRFDPFPGQRPTVQLAFRIGR